MLKKHVGNYVVNKEGYIFNVICDGMCLDYSTKLHDATSGNALDSIYTTMKITNLAYFSRTRSSPSLCRCWILDPAYDPRPPPSTSSGYFARLRVRRFYVIIS